MELPRSFSTHGHRTFERLKLRHLDFVRAGPVVGLRATMLDARTGILEELLGVGDTVSYGQIGSYGGRETVHLVGVEHGVAASHGSATGALVGFSLSLFSAGPVEE